MVQQLKAGKNVTFYMKQLRYGQHFGAQRKTVKLDGTILTEAGYQPNIEVPWHYHENAYFFFHLRGKLDEVNKKKSVTCTAGTLLFHHWQDPHYDKNFSNDARFFISKLKAGGSAIIMSRQRCSRAAFNCTIPPSSRCFAAFTSRCCRTTPRHKFRLTDS